MRQNLYGKCQNFLPASASTDTDKSAELCRACSNMYMPQHNRESERPAGIGLAAPSNLPAQTHKVPPQPAFQVHPVAEITHHGGGTRCRQVTGHVIVPTSGSGISDPVVALQLPESRLGTSNALTEWIPSGHDKYNRSLPSGLENNTGNEVRINRLACLDKPGLATAERCKAEAVTARKMDLYRGDQKYM
ncbi:hypothetical protein ON010_g1076 [Phytophthora cinnamomi]|nr:hypothetical protein ON010_g1076 [Phytophthora cinnamomi]